MAMGGMHEARAHTGQAPGQVARWDGATGRCLAIRK